MVEEWGTWWDVETGTNSGFLYQQNTMRDAMVAGLTLNLFNAHCDRVRMANIAQTVNVLQAMILTDGPRLLTTPTYHVFEMWQVHQGATLLPAHLTCHDYPRGGDAIPAWSASASRRGSDAMHITLCHADPSGAATLDVELGGGQPVEISGRVLNSPQLNGHNTFEDARAVAPRPLTPQEAAIKGGCLTITLPPASAAVVAVTLG